MTLSFDDRTHIEELLAIHRRNLHILKRQAAQFGSQNVPLNIANGIIHEQTSIAKYEVQLLESSAIHNNVPHQLQESLESPSKSPPVVVSSPIDIVIITALEEELEAVLGKLPTARRRVFDTDIHVYYQTKVTSASEDNETRTYQVVVMSLVDMGRIAATNAAQEALRRWTPQCVLLIGIAGGVADQDVALGDVLIADQVVDYELQKIEETGTKVRWKAYPVDLKWRAIAQSLRFGEWNSHITEVRPATGQPKRHVGTVASGDKVVAVADLLLQYHAVWPKLIGIEMEASGIASAALSQNPRPAFFMIRGVSDLANSEKNTQEVAAWRAYACDIAAAYAIGMLKSGLLPSRAYS